LRIEFFLEICGGCTFLLKYLFLQKAGDKQSDHLENEKKAGDKLSDLENEKIMMRRLNHVCENDYVPRIICDGEEEFNHRHLYLKFFLFYVILFFFLKWSL
jgi:hypothetical protein